MFGKGLLFVLAVLGISFGVNVDGILPYTTLSFDFPSMVFVVGISLLLLALKQTGSYVLDSVTLWAIQRKHAWNN
jgi:hypothetical protein